MRPRLIMSALRIVGENGSQKLPLRACVGSGGGRRRAFRGCCASICAPHLRPSPRAGGGRGGVAAAPRPGAPAGDRGAPLPRGRGGTACKFLKIFIRRFGRLIPRFCLFVRRNGRNDPSAVCGRLCVVERNLYFCIKSLTPGHAARPPTKTTLPGRRMRPRPPEGIR